MTPYIAATGGGVDCYSSNSGLFDSTCTAPSTYTAPSNHLVTCAQGVTGCYYGTGSVLGISFGRLHVVSHVK